MNDLDKIMYEKIMYDAIRSLKKQKSGDKLPYNYIVEVKHISKDGKLKGYSKLKNGKEVESYDYNSIRKS